MHGIICSHWLGSFGATVATQLISLKHDVIGIDLDKKYVENISDQLTHAVIADATDEHVLDELDIQRCEAVVVAIGEDIEASILCTASEKYGCKENLGQSQIQSPPYDFDSSECRKIIHPEEDMGVRGTITSYPMVSRYMSLEDDHYIVKIEIHANHHDT